MFTVFDAVKKMSYRGGKSRAMAQTKPNDLQYSPAVKWYFPPPPQA
jgi:hypothetical protein